MNVSVVVAAAASPILLNLSALSRVIYALNRFCSSAMMIAAAKARLSESISSNSSAYLGVSDEKYNMYKFQFNTSTWKIHTGNK